MATINYDRAVAYYDETRRYRDGVAERYRDAVLGCLPPGLPRRILELAVGTGLLGLPFILAGDDYVGVDISRGMMGRIQPKLGNGMIPQLAQANIEHTLPFPRDSFSLLQAVRVFHLLEDWRRCLRESRRVLRPGGRLLIVSNAAPTDAAADAPWDSVQRQWDKILRRLAVGEERIRHGIRRTDAMILSCLRSLGACARLVDLLPYLEREVSCRMMVERRAQRMFSSDWNLPEDTFARALIQLREWLEYECQTPDEMTARPMVFRAIVAHWNA